MDFSPTPVIRADLLLAFDEGVSFAWINTSFLRPLTVLSGVMFWLGGFCVVVFIIYIVVVVVVVVVVACC